MYIYIYIFYLYTHHLTIFICIPYNDLMTIKFPIVFMEINNTCNENCEYKNNI